MKTNISKATVELTIVALILIPSFLLFSKFDALGKIVEFSAEYEELGVDEILSTVIVLVFCMLWISFRRWRETLKSNKELQDALCEIKTLEGVISICMHCKEIRDDTGSWNRLENYICEHTDAQFSHGICKKCFKEHYPDYPVPQCSSKPNQAVPLTPPTSTMLTRQGLSLLK